MLLTPLAQQNTFEEAASVFKQQMGPVLATFIEVIQKQEEAIAPYRSGSEKILNALQESRDLANTISYNMKTLDSNACTPANHGRQPQMELEWSISITP